MDLGNPTVGQNTEGLPVEDSAHRHLVVSRVELCFRGHYDGRRIFESDRSPAIFARINEAAWSGEQVTSGALGPVTLGPSSLAALNSYLRTARGVRRFKLPFDRLNVANTRHDWAAFVAYLGLDQT